MSPLCFLIVFVALIFGEADAPRASADVVVDHQPGSIGLGNGPASDTLFPNPLGIPTWQQLADDFVLGAPVTLGAVGWWGFYGGTFGQASPNPPTGDETMRVRVYGSRESDGLPNQLSIVYEESLLNPFRIWTGRIAGDQREFYFEAQLTDAVLLEAQTTYWFEVAQIGDVNSLFRWEYSHAEWNGHTFLNASVPDWTPAPPADLAFRLVAIPEPATVVLASLLCACCSSRIDRERRSRRARSCVGGVDG